MYGIGAGILVDECGLTVFNSQFIGLSNTAIKSDLSQKLSVENCLFDSNVANNSYGGAILIEDTRNI